MFTTSILKILPRGRSTPTRIAHAAVDTVLQWQDRANQRHRLRTLSDFMLRDMGLSRADVEREACKPFWMK